MADTFILENKSGYIADSTVSSFLSHDAEQVSLYPILDHISLLFQRALDINVGIMIRDEVEIVFSNSWLPQTEKDAVRIMRDPVLRGQCMRLQRPRQWNGVDIYVLVRSVLPTSDPNGSGCVPLDKGDLDKLKSFFNDLTGSANLKITEVFRRAKRRAHRSEPAQLSHYANQPRLKAQEVVRLTANLSIELDYVYQSLSVVRSQKHTQLKQDVGNVFCAVRYVAEDTKIRQKRFPYSTQVVLSKAQARAVDEIGIYIGDARQQGLRPSQLLQQPLSEESRSIADAVFQSGIVEFPPEQAGEGRDSSRATHGDHSIDAARRRLEQRFLSGFGERLMHVPVHVSGVPWAVFFLVLPKMDADSAWLWVARFYRSCVPLLSDALRRIVRRQFLDELSAIIEAEFKTFLTTRDPLDPTLDTINAKVRALCGFFPYLPPQFSRLRRSPIAVDFKRDEQDFRFTITSDAQNPFLCFSDELGHDQLRANDHELKEYVGAGVERARAALDTARAARAVFASALAHDVKNSTNEIITRQDPALAVFRRTVVGKDYPAAGANLVRANIRAMMLNSIAMSINRLFMEHEPLGKPDTRVFPKKEVERFWVSILRLLLQMRALQERLDDDEQDPRRFRLVLAPSLGAMAEFHDNCCHTMPEPFAYPAEWEVAPPAELNALLADAMRVLHKTGGMLEGLADYRLGIGLAMLTEIVSNIRFNTNLAEAPYARDMIIGWDIRWSGNFPAIVLQQMHWESAASTWRPPVSVPDGIERTLSLFGPKPTALRIMSVEIASDPNCRNGIVEPSGAEGHLCSYALRIGLNLLQAS